MRKSPVRGDVDAVTALLDRYYALLDSSANLPEGERRTAYERRLELRRQLSALGYAWSRESVTSVTRAVTAATHRKAVL